MPEPTPSPIKAAALRSIDGKQVWTGCNHLSAYIATLLNPEFDGVGLEQGFVDEAGVFLTRVEAYDRAVLCGQIVADGGERYLIAEMLRLEP